MPSVATRGGQLVKHNPIHETMIARRVHAPGAALSAAARPAHALVVATNRLVSVHACIAWRLRSSFPLRHHPHTTVYTRLIYSSEFLYIYNTATRFADRAGSSRPHTDTPHTRRQNVQYTRNTLAITQWSKAQSHERYRTLDHRTATRSLPEPLYGISV